jgi:hypothetical protein
VLFILHVTAPPSFRLILAAARVTEDEERPKDEDDDQHEHQPDSEKRLRRPAGHHRTRSP